VPDPAAFDQGNPLLSPAHLGPAQIAVTLMTNPGTGTEHALITCHTSDATVSGLMTRDELTATIAVLTSKRDKMRALIVPGMCAPPPSNGRRP
jgi:hypothetical protein